MGSASELGIWIHVRPHSCGTKTYLMTMHTPGEAAHIVVRVLTYFRERTSAANGFTMHINVV